MVLLTVIAVATLLVAVVGATFAYFTASVQNDANMNENTGNTSIKTGQVANTTVVNNIEGAAGSFTATQVYPGHKEVAALQVTANGPQGAKTGVQFRYTVTENGLGDNVNVYLYKSATKIETTENYFECTQNATPVEGSSTGEVRYTETCQDKSVGTLVKKTTLTAGEQNIILGNDTIVNSVADTDETMYYYIVVEFENKDASQNSVMNTTLTGKVTVEAAPAE